MPHARDLAATITTVFFLATAIGCGSSSNGSPTGSGGATAASGGATGLGGDGAAGAAGTGGTVGSGGAAGTGGTAGSSGTGTGGDIFGGGDGGSGAGGAAGGDGFVAVSPCLHETDYLSTTTGTVSFGGGDIGFAYSPQCLKVAQGSLVLFHPAGADGFDVHPLRPSAARGTLTGNPITAPDPSAPAATYTFSTPGYYAYYCLNHGNDVTGDGMAGVIWVQ